MLSWVATALGIIGVLFVNYKSIYGYYFWVVGNIIFIYLAVLRKDFSQILLWSVYTLSSIHGIYMWKKV